MHRRFLLVAVGLVFGLAIVGAQERPSGSWSAAIDTVPSPVGGCC